MNKANKYYPQTRPHPGETLLEKLQEMGMRTQEFALQINKPEKMVAAILNGEGSITPDMAVWIENVTKIPASYWLNSQRNYDEIAVSNQRKELKDGITPHQAFFPLHQ